MSTVALVQGADFRHRRYYLEALRDLEAVTAVAVVDPAGATLAEARGLLPGKPVRAYASDADLLRAERVAMAIVTLSGAASPAAIAPLLTPASRSWRRSRPASPGTSSRAWWRRPSAGGCPSCWPSATAWRPGPGRPPDRGRGGAGRLYAARAMTLADQARIWDPLPGLDVP